jgi:hypothetical protein
MAIQEIATRLVELCRIGDYETAQKELYADNATSTEFSPQTQKLETAEGLEAIIAKGQHFRGLIEEVHSSTVGEPIFAGNYFSVAAFLEVTLKGLGKIQMDEIAVYKVVDGKVVSEQFFY